jgi:Cu-Zn family superoxide dismutase
MRPVATDKETDMRPVLLTPMIALALSACAAAPIASSPTAPSSPAMTPSTSTARVATTHLAGASGSLVSGTLTLMPMPDGVHVTGEIGGLAPGSSHGFHVHEKGDCSAADGSSAGGHFNPTGSAHGKAGTPVHHAGDIDNIVADASGIAHVDTHVAGVTLGGGAASDVVGRAVVVHAAPDDYQTQPSGNSGARIACGVIVAGQ